MWRLAIGNWELIWIAFKAPPALPQRAGTAPSSTAWLSPIRCESSRALQCGAPPRVKLPPPGSRTTVPSARRAAERRHPRAPRPPGPPPPPAPPPRPAAQNRPGEADETLTRVRALTGTATCRNRDEIRRQRTLRH